jgi:hypothetical protein
MLHGKVESKYIIDGEEFVEQVGADVCTDPNCDESYILNGELELAEQRVAMSLIAKSKTDPQSVRFMLGVAGIYIDEILMRYPTLDAETVKGWRHGRGPCPPEVLPWAQQVARLGYNPDCLCGQCLGGTRPRPRPAA